MAAALACGTDKSLACVMSVLRFLLKQPGQWRLLTELTIRLSVFCSHFGGDVDLRNGAIARTLLRLGRGVRHHGESMKPNNCYEFRG